MSLQSAKFEANFDFAALATTLTLGTVYYPTGPTGLGGVTATIGLSKTPVGRPIILRSIFNLAGGGVGQLRVLHGDGVTPYWGADWDRAANANGQGSAINLYLANGLSFSMQNVTNNWIVSFSIL